MVFPRYGLTQVRQAPRGALDIVGWLFLLIGLKVPGAR